MFDFKVSASQGLTVDLDITAAQNLFQQALETIGSYKDTEYKSADQVLLKGKSRYGLQGVPLVIQLDKTNDTTTSVTIGGKSDDVGGVGAKKCIERLITTFNTLNSKDTERIAALDTIPSFERRTGFSKKKLLFLVAGFVVLLIAIMQGSSASFYGTYKVHSDNYLLKEAVESQDIYMEVNKNGTIIYHAAMNGFPTVHNEGTFTEDNEVLHVNWSSGRLPSTLRLNKTGSSYTINISGTQYKN